jgi:hypothetical protein
MKFALLYNLNFTKGSTNLEKVCYSLAELCVKSAYFNVFGRREREVHETR